MESINWISPSKDRSNPCLAAEKMENIYIYIHRKMYLFPSAPSISTGNEDLTNRTEPNPKTQLG